MDNFDGTVNFTKFSNSLMQNKQKELEQFQGKESDPHLQNWLKNEITTLSQEASQKADKPISPMQALILYSLWNTPTILSNVTTIPHRGKRFAFLPLIGGAIGTAAAVNVIHSSVNGGAPFSWFGQGLSTLLGTVHESHPLISNIHTVAATLKSLSLNDDILLEAINRMNLQVNTYVGSIQGVYKATATNLIGSELRDVIRHNQLMIADTLAKHANILTTLAAGNISPYLLSETELQNLADQFYHSKGVSISTDMSLIRAKITPNENGLIFTFTIPIIDTTNIFRFFTITPLPYYFLNQTYIAEIDTNHIAISNQGSDYIKLTPEEFESCTSPKKTCTLTSLTTPLSSTSSCVITTYTTKNLTCDLKEVEQIQTPQFFIEGNHTWYSVPRSLKLYVRCNQNAGKQIQLKDDTVTIKGMGEIEFKEGCTITLPDGSKFKTPISDISSPLSDVPIYRMMNTYHLPTNVKISFLEEKIPPLPKISLNDVYLPTEEELRIETFHPLRFIPSLIQAALIIAFILFIISLLYCYRIPLRKMFGRYYICFCCKPYNWQRDNDVEAQNPNDNHRQNPVRQRASSFESLTDEMVKFSHHMKDTFANIKRSTQSLYQTQSFNDLPKIIPPSIATKEEKVDNKPPPYVSNQPAESKEDLEVEEPLMPPPPPQIRFVYSQPKPILKTFQHRVHFPRY